MSMNYYEELIRIVSQYLGPAAERFIMRQVEMHVRKPATDLTAEDMQVLSKSIPTALDVLDVGEVDVDEVEKHIQSLVE